MGIPGDFVENSPAKEFMQAAASPASEREHVRGGEDTLRTRETRHPESMTKPFLISLLRALSAWPT